MKIYHYTSIESLYLILKNRTMRFTTLTDVDDMDEGETEEFKLAKQYLFVSCWTEEVMESIPQWSVYSNDMQGVRLGIEIDENNPRKVFELENNPTTNLLISKDLGLVDNLPLVASPETPFYRKMKYTDDPTNLKPSILSQEKYGELIDMSKVALYKSLEWEFQKESRFIIDFSASPINPDLTSIKDFDLQHTMNTLNLPFDYKDISLADYFFENLEITFGPKCPEVHKDFVEMYLEKLNITADLKDSSLNIQ